eukprot:7946093-Prorocentrum_lima.AAC.1
MIRSPKGGSAGLTLDDPTGPDRYLGCKHVIRESSTTWHEARPSDEENAPGHIKQNVRYMEYDMEEFMSSCVDVYCSLAKVARDSLPE